MKLRYELSKNDCFFIERRDLNCLINAVYLKIQLIKKLFKHHSAVFRVTL